MEQYPITVGVEYSDRLSRLTTFFRGILIIPHSIVIAALGIVAGILLFISWWAILFMGRYPRGMFNFVSGYLRWITRVNGYSYFLTDKYPPFSMS
jgi:ABC-type multidrug transport system permease subunit